MSFDRDWRNLGEDLGTITLGQYRELEAAGRLDPPPAPAAPSGVDALREAIYPRGIDVAWMEDANCKGIDVDVFFPPHGNGTHVLASRICGECLVRSECLEYALVVQPGMNRMLDFGFWGGRNTVERLEIKRSRRRRGVAA